MLTRQIRALSCLTILAVPLLAQPVPAIIRDINEITDGKGSGPGGQTPGAPRRTASSLPSELSLLTTDRVWFAATSHLYGREPWGYRPASSPPEAYRDLLASLPSSDPGLLTPVVSRLFFSAKDSSGEEGLRTLDANDAPSSIAMGTPPAGTRIRDIAPMSTGAIVATEASNTTTFWQITANSTPTATSLSPSINYVFVSDLIDCDFTNQGFFAFTCADPNSLTQRVLMVWSANGQVTVHTGDVDNLTAIGTTLYFSSSDGDSTKLYKVASDGTKVEIHDTGDSISHLMPATVKGSQVLFFLQGTAGDSYDACRYPSSSGIDGVEELAWPTSVWVKTLGAATLAQGTPHVLGVGKLGSAWFSAIWKLNVGGTAMEQLTQLPGWSDCSQLVTNDTGKLAFVGRYHASTPDLRVPHLGFVKSTPLTVTVKPIPDLRAGAMPTSLLSLSTRVLFVADHRLLGIEPWSCDYPP